MRPPNVLFPLLVLCVLWQPLAGHAQPVNEGDSLATIAQGVERDLVALESLAQQIRQAAPQSRDALVYRREELGLRLMQDINRWVKFADQMPEDAAAAPDVERLKAVLQGAGDTGLERIAEVNKRIDTLQASLAEQSGAQRVTSEANLDSLRDLRLRYYKALVEVVEHQTSLGLPGALLKAKFLPALNGLAEVLAGRVELTGRQLKALQQRFGAETGNTDLEQAISALERQQAAAIGQLETAVDLLLSLDADPVRFRSVLLEAGQGLSITTLESGAIGSFIDESWSRIKVRLVDEAPDLLFNLAVFVIIVLLFRSLSRLSRSAVRAACERPGVDISTLLKDVLVSVCGGTVMVVGVLIALSQIGISLGPMLAGLGVAGFVVGFALQDTLANFAAGGMILAYRPYDVDDYVEVAGAAGLVKKMSLVSTTITTFDNQTLVVPNSKIWGDVIKNVTAQQVRRVDLLFGIGYGDDIAQAETILADVLTTHEKVLDKPEPLIKVHELGDSSVNLAVRPWVRTEDYWTVYWDLTREVKLRFDKEGISIPFPQRDVHVIREEG